MDRQIKKRHIRVFISSTFRDMQEERDLLVKRIFPELRKRCRQRGVEFTEVDLRWGVTEEQAERGEVLPICLREIENSRPYFICLLGDRYGWVPPTEMISRDLMEAQPWLADHKEKSVTELEIIHGVLANTEMNDRAFFYFRDHSYTDQIGSTRAGDFRENDPGQTARLDRLKQKIRESGCTVRENYKDPYEVADYILEDLRKVIDEEFPEGSKPGPLDREISEHEQYAETRRRVYVGREEYFLKLDEHAGSREPPLVITGESGSGKSALVANWVDRYRRQNPEEFIIQHYLGSSPQSADHIMIIERIMQEVKRRFSIAEELPAEPGELKKAFPQWLAMAARRGKMIVILDGLNQLEDTDNARELYWLPCSFPDAIRVIISTLPGHVLDVMNGRGWQQFSVFPLKEDERRSPVMEYLARFTKTLDRKQLDTIVRSPQTGNPLFLRVLLDEMRVFGIYEQLNDLMAGYLAADGPTELYGKILARLERDYEQSCPGLARDALSLIWASRRGLSEAELLDMLGADGDPLPRAVWAPLYLALEDSLIMREGLLNFFHDYLRQAVYERYIGAADNEKARHTEIADYFINTDTDYRKADELPWQLKQVRDWERLAEVMQDPDLLSEIWDRNQYEVKEYWTLIEQKTGLSPAEAFRKFVDDPGEFLDGIWAVTLLLDDLGYSDESFRLLSFLEENLNEGSANQVMMRNRKATILRDWGRIDEAMALYKLNEENARLSGDENAINTALANQAILLAIQGRLKEAHELYIRLEKKHRLSGDKYSLAVVLTNMGRIIHDFGKQHEALAMFEEAEQFARELGYRDEVDLVRVNRAMVLEELGHSEEALLLLREVEKSSRQIGDREGLSSSLALQAQFFYRGDQLDKALDYCRQSSDLLSQLGNKSELGKILGLQASILNNLGGRDKALDMHKQAEEMHRELGDMHSLAICLKDQGMLLFDMDRIEEALGLFSESARILREIGNVYDLRTILSGLILIFNEMGPEEELPALYEEYEELCLETGAKDGLIEYLGNHADLMNRMDKHEEALRLLQQQEQLMRDTGETENLGMNLGNQGLTLSNIGRFEEAMEMHVRSGEVFEEQGNIIGVSISYSNQGLIYREWERHEEALMMHEKEEALSRKLKFADGLIRSLGYQALALYELKRYKEALKFFREQEKIARKNKTDIGELFSYTRKLAEKMLNKGKNKK